MEVLDAESERLLEDATYACNCGRFSEALPVFERFAAVGNINAICGLAQMYLSGQGVSANVATGLAFLRGAVELGHANSAFSLGALHRSGDHGVPKNEALSRRYFLRAKELGCEIPIDKYL